MRARKNRRDLKVLLTTKKPRGDAICLDDIFSVGSSLDVVVTGNVVMEPKSGPNSICLPTTILCNGHDDTFTLVNSLDVVVAGNVMVDPRRYPNAICVPSTVPMHNSFDHTKNAVYKPKICVKRAKYSRKGRSKVVSFQDIRAKLGSADGEAEGCNDANTVQMSEKKSAYKQNARINRAKSTRKSEIQSRSKVVTYKEIRAELDSAGGERESKNDNIERLDESFTRTCARVSSRALSSAAAETSMPSALSVVLRVSDTTAVISNPALSQHSNSDASTPVVSNRTNSRARSQSSGSDATTPVVSNRTTSRGDGLHGSVRRTGIWTSMGLRHSGKVTNSFGPTPIPTDTLKRVRKYSPQA
jgi:hypothetical protein